jgi:5-formyltetrahydrofolate cyclo-ligase
MQSHAEMQELKRQIRRRAESARQAETDRDALSRAICHRFAALPEYSAAGTVMLYVGIRSEVRTQPLLSVAVAQGKRVVVPYCVGNELGLFLLESLDELAPGIYGIPEPRPELRALPGKRLQAERIDVVMVPGVAFDRRGGTASFPDCDRTPWPSAWPSSANWSPRFRCSPATCSWTG